MSTGTDIVQRALQEIKAHSPIKPAHPESIERGRKVLNGYISELQDDNIDFGAVPLEAVGDELSEAQGATNAIVANLAILLQPGQAGTNVSPELRVNAVKGAALLKRKFKTITIPRQVVRQTLPKGTGNSRYSEDPIYFNNSESIGES